MGTELKRVSITLSMDIARELEQLKRRYYETSEGEILRILLKKGADAFRAEDGNVYLHGEESPLRSFTPTFPVPVELPTEAIPAPFGRFYVCEEVERLDGGIRKVKVNKIVNEEGYWICGYLTAENVLYFEHENEMLAFRLDGRILKGKKPICIDGEYFLPVVLKKKKEVSDTNEPCIECAVNGPSCYFFSCTTERLYRHENGLLKPLRSAERGL